ncbi:flagellar biosynthesis protein FlhF, partial [Piscibacillus halophilus]
MKVKKYTAPTMPEAMKVVRHDLGKSAVILNSREQKTKGFLGLFRRKYIEVFAAVEPNPVPKKLEKPKKGPITEFRVQPPEDDLLKELERLKRQLNQTQHHQDQQNVLPKPIQYIFNQLEQQEIDNKVMEQLTPFLLEKYYADRLKDYSSLLNETKQFFENQLHKEQSDSTSLCNAKYIYLFGPTGVGKTTTIAKLAASQSITEGKRVAFITLDTYRIAAIDQLKTYAKILNIPIKVAYNHEDFLRAKESFKDYDVVFIDSAGRNYRKDEYMDELKEYVNFHEDEEIYCVLSLTSKQKDLEDIYSRFSQLKIDRVIFTKLDETT